MGADKRWRLIAYDVREPVRYRRVHKLMRGSGRPLQYSIFRARLDDREIERLRWELARLMTKEDRLLIVDLCPRCASRVISRSDLTEWIEEEPSFEILPRGEDQAPSSGGEEEGE